MIIKTIYPNLKIHPFVYVLTLLLLITGRVKPFLIFMSLIIVHELGHFQAAKLLHWRVDKIELYPYGGISKFQTFVNVPIKQELFVLIIGPLTQMVFVYGCSFLLSEKNLEIMNTYHQFLLWFNLLPIYPLDGGRIVHLFCSEYLSFRKSFYLVVILSYLTVLIITTGAVLKNSIFFVCVLLLVVLKTEKERSFFPYVFHKFLLERVLYHWNFPKKIVISKESEMKRDTYHFFKKGEDYLREEEYLKELPNKKIETKSSF